jgi:hypothetical protein
LLNRISHKDNKNKKNNKNIFNLNYNFNNINDKRKAHSSSLSKNKKHKFTKKNVHIHNTNNNIINSITDINKKQKTLNNIVSSYNRIKPTTIKCLKKSKINIGNDANDQLKIKTITLSHLNAWNSKNKLNKKSINSIGSSLNNTKNINKTKSKSNSKSNSKNHKTNKNKNSYNKLLTENIKNEKSNIYNIRISAMHKEKTLIIKKIGKLNEKTNDKKINKNSNVKNVNKNLLKTKTNYSNFNSFQNNIENSNITDSQINLNRKRGINLIIAGQNQSKKNNDKINNIIYNINRKNIYLNNNSSKLKCNESNNIHNSMKKTNMTNNQKGNVPRNSKNLVSNNNYNVSVTSKKLLIL